MDLERNGAFFHRMECNGRGGMLWNEVDSWRMDWNGFRCDAIDSL